MGKPFAFFPLCGPFDAPDSGGTMLVRGGKSGPPAIRFRLKKPTRVRRRAAGRSDRSRRGVTRLEQFDRRKAQIIELKFFGGMTEAEAAEALRISERTLHR